jgi:hypothetical protein
MDKIVPYFGCSAKFISASVLVEHLEIGVCSSKTDRTTVTSWARKCAESAFKASFRLTRLISSLKSTR